MHSSRLQNCCAIEALMEAAKGAVTCGSWIRRPENVNFVVLAKSSSSSSSVLEIFSFDPDATSLSPSPLAGYVLEQTEGEIVAIAVHPSGDQFVCSTTKAGCRLFELQGQETQIRLLAKELPPLESVGPQKCLAFSVDGSRFATGGMDGHLRILEWPSLRIISEEPKAHKSFNDMDISLDSAFLASTSSDGSARIWNIEDGVPLTTLTRDSDEKIELCRFSKDGTKPFLFCAVQRGDKAITVVYDISTWKKIGYKRLLKKPACIMSVSLDGKYLALGSKDGDFCVAEVKKMEVSHWSRRLHLGTRIRSLDFCPNRRVVLSTSEEWGAVVTKLNVPADWKEWQIYLLLVGLFVASALAFYVLFQNSDAFWKSPLGKNQATRPKFQSVLQDPHSDDVFLPLDM